MPEIQDKTYNMIVLQLLGNRLYETFSANNTKETKILIGCIKRCINDLESALLKEQETQQN